MSLVKQQSGYADQAQPGQKVWIPGLGRWMLVEDVNTDKGAEGTTLTVWLEGVYDPEQMIEITLNPETMVFLIDNTQAEVAAPEGMD